MATTRTLVLTLGLAAAMSTVAWGGSQPARGGPGSVAYAGSVCPQCGARLVPVCHVGWSTKKVIEYQYREVCEEICVPGTTPICKRRTDCNLPGRCTVHEIRKLAKYPVTKEVPVRRYTVEWVCPNCGRAGGAKPQSASTAAR